MATNRPTKSTYDLSDAEKRDLIALNRFDAVARVGAGAKV
jgi:hypothetical protein